MVTAQMKRNKLEKWIVIWFLISADKIVDNIKDPIFRRHSQSISQVLSAN